MPIFLKPLAGSVSLLQRQAGNVAARSCERRDKASTYWVTSALEHDRNRQGCLFNGLNRLCSAGGNDADVKAAAEEEDKLLNTKIKSICRGC